MTDFTIHTAETAPEESRPLLENSQKAFGRIPGLHAVMAEAPALLEGYQLMHKLFAEKTSFDKDELHGDLADHQRRERVPLLRACSHGIAQAMKVDDAITHALRDETLLPNAPTRGAAHVHSARGSRPGLCR